MSKQTGAIKLAIEVFGGGDWHDEIVDTDWADKANNAITVLREALAEQPAQQNGPWCMKMNGCKTKCEDCPDEVAEQQCKWPTCQSEEYQQALAEQIRCELVGEQPAQHEPEIVQRVRRYAGQTLRTARNPNITARECIELADWLATHGITKGTT